MGKIMVSYDIVWYNPGDQVDQKTFFAGSPFVGDQKFGASILTLLRFLKWSEAEQGWQS